MKHILLLFLGFSTMVFNSCEDDLESKVYSDLSPVNFFSSEADFKTANAALYAPFTTDWGTPDVGGNLFHAHPGMGLYCYQEASTDEAITTWDLVITNFNVGPATFNIDNWQSVYAKIRYIARATDNIDKFQKSTAVGLEVKKLYIAEAKVMRAWLSYILYDIYGPVGAIYDPKQLLSTEVLPRPANAAYLDQMIKDLTEAIPDLPEKYNGTNNWGRVSKNVARMILLRIYLNDKQWLEAETIGKEILTNGGYTLLPDYKDVFNVAGNDEIIYAIPSESSLPNYYPTISTIVGIKDANDGLIKPSIQGWDGWRMPWKFYEKYEDGDERLQTIIASYIDLNGDVQDRTSGLGENGACPVKFTDLSKFSGTGYLVDWPVFRAAEVYLSIAEAINEQTGPNEAYVWVNQVRARSGVNDLVGLTKDEFRDQILDERGRELFMEGVRRTDLIRHGKFISNAIARGKNAKDYQALFPIPADVVLQSNGSIQQNPGY